jgi:hypothetical protein
MVTDALSSMFPVKYRWPVFALDAGLHQDYEAIIDEECKVRARTPHVSKFRHMPFDFSDDERRRIYQRDVSEHGRSRPNNVAAFFRATFDAWRDFRRTGDEVVYVGYSPIIVIDAQKILGDFPQAHVLHVVRNPWSAYADTKKRPVPLALQDYMLGWTVSQYHALLFQDRFPDRMRIVRAEDVMDDARAALGPVCAALGLDSPASLSTPTWNGMPLTEISPWGTIRTPTLEANRATAQELSAREREEIASLTRHYLEVFDYKGFLGK